MGRPKVIFRDRACPFTPEDAGLIRDNLPSQHELLREKLERAIMTVDPVNLVRSEYQGLLDAIQTIRRSGVNLSGDLERFEKELAAEIQL